MARELQIVYGALTVGGTSGREITGVVVNTKKFQEIVFEFEFDIYKSTLATFNTEISAVEDAFRKPFQDFTLSQDGTTLYTFSQSSNTGLDAQPEITKRVDNASGRSRRYGVRIVIGLPANTGAEAATGLREHGVEVAYGPNRIRTVTVWGMFTAVSGSSARAQYEAQIGGLESSVFSALSITAANRELIEEPVADQSYNNKTLQFRRVWRELIFSQGGASFDDSAIKGQRLQVARNYEAPGDTPKAKRLIILNVQYDCWLDKDVTTDILGKYNSIRSWLFQRIQNTVSGSTLAILEEEATPLYDENRLSVRIVGRALQSSTTIIQQTISLEDELQTGWTLVHAWTDDPLSMYDYQGPAVRRRTVTDTKTVPGFVHEIPAEKGDAGQSIFSGAGIDVVKAPGLAVKHIASKPQFIHKRLGRDGRQIDVTDIVKTDVWQFYKPISGSNSVAT